MDSTLIGLCDGDIHPHRHRTGPLTNKAGGRPDQLPGVAPPCPRCARCGAPLALVAQVYCPLDAYHRLLHLFACPGPGCSGRPEGWTVLRSQGLEAEEAASAPPAPVNEPRVAATDWCDSADDWGLDEEKKEEEGGGGGGVKEDKVQEEATGPALSCRLQDLSLQESPDDVPVFRPFFISVMEEADLCGEDPGSDHVQELLRDYEKREGAAVPQLDGGGGGGGGEEKYEKSGARHGDAVFSRFMKKISPCPQQILRYHRGGTPLLISESPAQLAPACGSCGGSRTFELQLMPALVSLLRREVGGGGGVQESQLEFGTVLVYTCTNSCWTSGSGSAVEEFCLVQADPDQQLFK